MSSGHFYVDEDRLGRQAQPYRDAAQDFERLTRRLHELEARYGNAYGSDDTGQKFSPQFRDTIQALRAAIDSLAETLNHNATGLHKTSNTFKDVGDQSMKMGYRLQESIPDAAAGGGMVPSGYDPSGRPLYALREEQAPMAKVRAVSKALPFQEAIAQGLGPDGKPLPLGHLKPVHAIAPAYREVLPAGTEPRKVQESHVGDIAHRETLPVQPAGTEPRKVQESHVGDIAHRETLPVQPMGTEPRKVQESHVGDIAHRETLPVQPMGTEPRKVQESHVGDMQKPIGPAPCGKIAHSKAEAAPGQPFYNGDVPGLQPKPGAVVDPSIPSDDWGPWYRYPDGKSVPHPSVSTTALAADEPPR